MFYVTYIYLIATSHKVYATLLSTVCIALVLFSIKYLINYYYIPPFLVALFKFSFDKFPRSRYV